MMALFTSTHCTDRSTRFQDRAGAYRYRTSRRATYGYIIRSNEEMKWIKYILEIALTAFRVWAGQLVGKVEDSTKATEESQQKVEQLTKEKDDLLRQLGLHK